MSDNRQTVGSIDRDHLIAFVGTGIDQNTDGAEPCYPQSINDLDLGCVFSGSNLFPLSSWWSSSPTDNASGDHEGVQEGQFRLVQRPASQQTRRRQERTIIKPRYKRHVSAQLHRWLDETRDEEPWIAPTLRYLVVVGEKTATDPLKRENKL